MGSIHQPPLANLALALSKSAGLRDFVETGTFHGHALGWASQNFERVWTIEINRGFMEQARANNPAAQNVTYLLGDSATKLGEVCDRLSGPALFWLDAHAGAGFYGKEDNCPLAAELETILSSRYPHCILIDDARAFTAPPPPPFDYKKWPSLDEIFALFRQRTDYHFVLIADCLIAAPRAHRDLIARFCFALRPKI